jgi:glycine/D-amino acid oxidase-like deaminating enzyme
VFTTVLLTEKSLTAHDVERFAHLHDPEPIRIHVVVPAHDDRSELEEVVDDLSRADFSEALHDDHDGRTDAKRAVGAEREVAVSVAALLAAGVAEVDGEVATTNPVDAVVALVAELGADEVVVLTEPHLLTDLTRRDWATRLRHAVDKPVLHVVLGTDQVVS